MQMKFYSPLTADFFPNDTEDLDDDYSEYEGIPYTGKELAGYRDVIRNAIYEDHYSPKLPFSKPLCCICCTRPRPKNKTSRW